MSINSESVSGSFSSSFPSPGAKTRVRNKERSVSTHEPQGDKRGAVRTQIVPASPSLSVGLSLRASTIAAL